MVSETLEYCQIACLTRLNATLHQPLHLLGCLRPQKQTDNVVARIGILRILGGKLNPRNALDRRILACPAKFTQAVKGVVVGECKGFEAALLR